MELKFNINIELSLTPEQLSELPVNLTNDDSEHTKLKQFLVKEIWKVLDYSHINPLSVKKTIINQIEEN